VHRFLDVLIFAPGRYDSDARDMYWLEAACRILGQAVLVFPQRTKGIHDRLWQNLLWSNSQVNREAARHNLGGGTSSWLENSDGPKGRQVHPQ
jgi:hypothetical protein